MGGVSLLRRNLSGRLLLRARKGRLIRRKGAFGPSWFLFAEVRKVCVVFVRLAKFIARKRNYLPWKRISKNVLEEIATVFMETLRRADIHLGPERVLDFVTGRGVLYGQNFSCVVSILRNLENFDDHIVQLQCIRRHLFQLHNIKIVKFDSRNYTHR